MNEIAAKARISEEIETLECQASAIEDRIHRLREILEAMEDSTVASVLSKAFSPESEIAPARSKKPAPKSHFEKIVAFFEARNNEPATAAEVTAGTGIKRASARDVLGRANVSDFAWTQEVENKPKKFFLKKFTRKIAVAG